MTADWISEIKRAYEADDYGRALAIAQEKHALAPDDADCLFHIGLCSLELGDYDEAVAALETAARIVPNEADIRIRLGGAYCGKKQHAKALEQYHAALSLDPHAPFAYLGLAWAHRERGDLTAAKDALTQAKRLAPGLGSVDLSLGQVAEREGDHEGALCHYERAMLLGEEVAFDLQRLGAALIDAKRYEQGKKVLERVFALTPRNSNVAWNLAVACLRLNSPDEALFYLNRVLELSPVDADVYKALLTAYRMKRDWRGRWRSLLRVCFRNMRSDHSEE